MSEVDPLNRRLPDGQLKSYPKSFFKNRNEILQPLLECVFREGAVSSQFLNNPKLAAYDERVVEYPFLLEYILKHAKKRELLDVGCVANNELMTPYLSKILDFLWLQNPSVESLNVNCNVGYLRADMRKNNIPSRIKFPTVSCLSTLEHIGMDNRRYGGEGKEFKGECLDPERFAIDGLTSLVNRIDSSGTLLLTVPFGPFEYLYSLGKLGDPIYYSFDRARLIALLESQPNMKWQTRIFKVVPDQGWIETNLEDESILSYGVRCAAAGAVAVIFGNK